MLRKLFMLGREYSHRPLVTVVKLSGVIAPPTGPPRSPQARRIINVERAELWLQRAFHPWLEADAVAVVINSPGGAPVQADLLAQRITQLSRERKVPVFTFAQDVAASGGYWLMCAGKEAYASPTSLVGSIGVITASFGAHDLLKRIGVERRVYTAGEDKALMDPFLPTTPRQEERLRELLGDMHVAFQDAVRASRGERLKGPPAELFSGRAWTGRQAVGLGLLDGLGHMEGVMRCKLGDQVQFVNCTPQPTGGLADMLFPSRWSLPGSRGQDAAYHASRAAAAAVLDELDQRALWAHYGLSPAA